MFGFPQSTEFNKRIPKQKFYQKTDIPPAIKQTFAEQIKFIYWRNKLAPATLNLSAGDIVTEVEVFELKLNAPQLDEAALRLIDRQIPYHILFVLTFEERAQACIGYKESSGGKTSDVKRYYRTDWLPEGELKFTVEGLNTDAVYESLVRQVAGEILRSAASESLKISVARDEERRRLEKQIATLENKIRREKQLNRQVQLNAELKKLKIQLKAIKTTSEEIPNGQDEV